MPIIPDIYWCEHKWYRQPLLAIVYGVKAKKYFKQSLKLNIMKKSPHASCGHLDKRKGKHSKALSTGE